LPAATRAFIRARTLRRAIVAGTAAAAALLLFAAPALAHISVTPDSAPAGSATVLTFHVPNEEAKADTVRVDMQIPTDHPIAQLLVKPVPGWTISVRTVTLSKPIVTDDGQFTQAVSEVIWSGGQILPGQFQDFTVSADPLPDGLKQMVFKAIQTYSNGDVVRWIDLQQAGQPAPDHPAPVLTLTTATVPGTTTQATVAGSGTDGTARGLAIAALLAGLLALAAALRRRRLPTPVGGAGALANGDRAGSPAVERVVESKPAGAKATRPQNPPRRRS
jgi:periplasmic copper chaperone A